MLLSWVIELGWRPAVHILGFGHICKEVILSLYNHPSRYFMILQHYKGFTVIKIIDIDLSDDATMGYYVWRSFRDQHMGIRPYYKLGILPSYNVPSRSYFIFQPYLRFQNHHIRVLQ